MLDVAEHVDPVVLAFFPNRERRRGEIGVVERTERDCNQPVELALDLVVHVRPAVGTEVKGDPVAAVGEIDPRFRLALDLNLFRRPARLDGEGATGAFLAVEAMTDGDADRIATGDGAELAAAAGRTVRGHCAAFFIPSR